jgi:hypothetical protein
VISDAIVKCNLTKEMQMTPPHKLYRSSTAVVKREIADETILVPIRKSAEELDSIYTVNEVAARIWDLMDGKKTVTEIKKTILNEYDVTPEELDRDVEELISKLLSERLIEES